MNENEINAARAIFAKEPKHWTNEDNKYLYSLFKKGYRNELKTLRNQVLLEE